MKNVIWLLLTLSLFVFGCKAKTEMNNSNVVVVKTPPIPPPLPDSQENADNEPIPYRVSFSFYSIGEGIDAAQHDKWVEFLEKYSPALLYDKTPWGREGEVDYCLMLKELKLKEQEEFVAASKKLLEKCIRVHINEFKPCPHKK